MSTLRATAAIGTLILLAANNAHAWDQRNNNTHTSTVASQSIGAVSSLGTNTGNGLEFTAAQSKSMGTAKVTPNSATTKSSQEGSGVSFGLGNTAGAYEFTAKSFSSAFGKDFRGK